MNTSKPRDRQQQKILERTWTAFRKAANSDRVPAPVSPRQPDYWPEPGFAG